MDFSKIPRPPSIESFHPLYHSPPIRQDTSNTCWCFSGTSFLESELYRLYNKKIKLSEMFTVYWEYIEKTKRFIREKGNSTFDEGSQENAVFLRMKQYGAVRTNDYTGLLEGQTKHNHQEMFKKMQQYLSFIKRNEIWNEELVLSNIKDVLNMYMGEPPQVIDVDGEEMTPKTYLEKVLRFPLDDYVSFMSFKYIPFYVQSEYKVPDNWWHNNQYYNIPLDQWYQTIKKAVQDGFTVGVGGDISELGISSENDIAIIPNFDVMQNNINQDSREFRFYNKTSTDDHGVHLIGYQRFNGYDWFLVKDSGASAQRGQFKGYYFYRGDWMKLKMLTFVVHKDAVEKAIFMDIKTREAKATSE